MFKRRATELVALLSSLSLAVLLVVGLSTDLPRQVFGEKTTGAIEQVGETIYFDRSLKTEWTFVNVGRDGHVKSAMLYYPSSGGNVMFRVNRGTELGPLDFAPDSVSEKQFLLWVERIKKGGRKSAS